MNRMRSGSALLIVLGMLSFMLFSGLAFSVYMRYSRLPTSFLRRTTTTRQLAKAALAEAIEDIDMAIGHNPHPGISTNAYVSGVASNVWYHRIFFGYEPQNKIVPSNDKVPTLTLEGLAYLPPDMINDVRYYSRCTPTANWHSFWFDSGRYAYTAIDVSDYFDVNRILVDKGRASSASRRISMSYLFENVEGSGEEEEHTGLDDSALKAWEDLMKDCREVDDAGKITYQSDDPGSGKGPFVSLAEFNIAWNKTLKIGGAEIESPFRRMVKREGDGMPYKDISSANEPNAGPYKMLTFVTDSWTPVQANTETESVAILKPFGNLDPKSVHGLDEVLAQAPKDRSKGLGKHLSLFGAAQLWDYLDTDSIPISLAMPTLERTPMVVGLECGRENALPKVSFKREVVEEGEGSQKGYKRRVVDYKLTLTGQRAIVSALAAYPFKQYKGKGLEDEGEFTVDGRLALFFKLAGSEEKNALRFSGNQAFQITDGLLKNSAFDDANSVVSIALSEQVKNKFDASNFSMDEPTDGDSKPAYVRGTTLSGNMTALGDPPTMFTVTYEWPDKDDNQKPTGIDPESEQSGGKYITAAECKFKPFSKSGENDALSDNGKLVDYLKGVESASLSVHAAVWVRVVNGDKKTVDLVPAGVSDDEKFGIPSSSRLKLVAGSGNNPLMRFDLKAGDGTIPVTISAIRNSEKQPYSLTANHSKVFVSDPRYNHLPENWYYTASNGGMTPKDWADEVKNIVGQGDTDSDIYMATSDQGYLQSVYELAFLPRWTENMLLEGGEGSSYATGIYPTTIPQKDGFKEGQASAKDNACMWRTYRCYYRTEADKSQYQDPKTFQELASSCRNGGPGVNPYSDSTNVLMAAFANTPIDWRCASTNENSKAKDAKKVKDFNAGKDGLAWNGYDGNSKEKSMLCWKHLKKVAGHFKDWVCAKGNWEEAYQNLLWSPDKGYLLQGVKLDDDDADLYGVDKKFLCGFWHDSFTPGQQLFLIFVRAEPMMMGGGVSGQTPPQLGARAVALVWRDPNPFADAMGSRSKSDDENLKKTPDIHRTRILFYHQFD